MGKQLVPEPLFTSLFLHFVISLCSRGVYCRVHTKGAAEKHQTADYIRSSVAELLHEMCLDSEVPTSQRKFERRKMSRSVGRVRPARLFFLGAACFAIWGFIGRGGAPSPYNRPHIIGVTTKYFYMYCCDAVCLSVLFAGSCFSVWLFSWFGQVAQASAR